MGYDFTLGLTMPMNSTHFHRLGLMSPSSQDSNLGPYRLFLRFLTALAGDQTPVPRGEPNSEASTCQVEWEANQVLIQGLDPEGQCHFILGSCPVTETHSSRESWGQGHHNLPIALPRESPLYTLRH